MCIMIHMNMMNDDPYFELLYQKATQSRFNPEISFHRMLYFLHSTEFTWTLENDANRADDGLKLRYRILTSHPELMKNPNLCIYSFTFNTCSVLELILSLAERMEQILASFDLGDRTLQWVWNMLTSIGIATVSDDIYHEPYVKMQVTNMLNRNYEFTGKGGLFYIPTTTIDLRTLPIWDQVNMFVTHLSL